MSVHSCRDCHKTWTGLAKAHCVVCHETFSTNGTADLHWRKSGHIDPQTVPRIWKATDGTFRQVGENPHIPLSTRG